MVEETSQRRDSWRRWLLRLTAVLALVQAGAVIRALRLPDELAGQVSLIIPLEVAAGLLWAAAFMYLTWMLWRAKPRGLRNTALALEAFAVYSFGRLALFTRADYDRGRLPFLLVLTIIVLLLPVAYFIHEARTKAP